MDAGITGDVEFVSFKDGDVVLRLTGNFWHNRQMVRVSVCVHRHTDEDKAHTTINTRT